MMNLVVPFGFYGSGNIGDEATLQGFARLLQHCDDHANVAIASRNPKHTARVEPAFSYFNALGRDPRRWWAKWRGSAHAFVGGTPIMDGLGHWPLSELVPLVKSARRRGCPIVFVGIGTEKLNRDESRRIISQQIAPNVRHWSVRCERDKQRLLENGVTSKSITVAADLAWLIERATPDFGRHRMQRWDLEHAEHVVGVNLVNEGELLEKQPKIALELARALDEMVEKRGSRILFLSNEIRDESSFDTNAARHVIANMKRQNATLLAPADYLAPHEMMSIIGWCDLTIGMRYHFCLFSAIQGVPFVAIKRSDKVADLCWDLDWQATIDPMQFNSADVIAHFDQVTTRAVPLDRIMEMRKRAARNLLPLVAIADGQPDFADDELLAES
jgi:polysaccharide pyruvyl transferase WcaK-like protein